MKKKGKCTKGDNDGVIHKLQIEHMWIHYVRLTDVPGAAAAEMRRQMSEMMHFYATQIWFVSKATN